MEASENLRFSEEVNQFVQIPVTLEREFGNDP